MNLVTTSLGFLRMWKSILGEGEREGEEKSFGEEDYHNKMKLFWDAIPNEKLSEKIIMILMIIIKEVISRLKNVCQHSFRDRYKT